MDIDIDHYEVLGLASGEEGAKLTENEISKAYKKKALELHPDKRRDDPDAHANFQKLKSSYEILKDEKARKLFDDLLRVKRERYVHSFQRDSKRQKMVSDLEARERAAFAPDPVAKAREEEDMIARKLKEEIERIRAMHANKGAHATSASKREAVGVARESVNNTDREKMLKVSWEKGGEDYSAERLKELFSKFGEVEDVVISSSKKKRSALVQMATKEAAVAATGSVSGDLNNPLLVLPVKPAIATEFPSFQQQSESAHVNNLVGTGYKAYEDSILEKLQKGQ
ncbi:dnaJ homolog subfamily C member 17 isoform X2 [Ricinus communis]|uniref:dnaJ homolog subfamily C member 17 isoform X2 n=1 Tax=Ricinus communis TaxID=3988 RepID=UPI00201AC254|nr:dnaJ homolog subfamily C member 17 isoform X2 [Ricinus communis]